MSSDQQDLAESDPQPARKRQKTQAGVRPRKDSQSQGDGRTRRKTACQTCRLRKVKCDGARPTCGLCRTTSSDCEYTDPLPEKLTLESATKLLCSKLDHVQDVLDTLQSTAQLSSQPIYSPIEPSVAAVSPAGRPSLRTFSNATHGEQPIRTEPASAGDFLQIPAHRTTADTVLGWQVFDDRWPPMSLIGVHFQRVDGMSDEGLDDAQQMFTASGGLLPLNEERIPLLVDKFLVNVHTKNPVLDVQMLVKQSRLIAVNGLTWDGWSCLVLLASALGTIAKPFVASGTSSPEREYGSGVPATADELQQGESYFVLACRRLGCLKYSILSAQCYFFAGVYLMYTLRPLLSWQHFTQASNIYQLHMKTSHRLAADISHCQQIPLLNQGPHNVTQRRLEESMYWSCFKSESEFRVELPLPQTELSHYSHPSLFPSPPSPATGRVPEVAVLDDESTTAGSPLVRTRTMSHHRAGSSANEDLEIRRHAKELCNEEESWYYYLTEIALRRIGNRIINAFFGHRSFDDWLHVKDMLAIALEYDAQVSAWSANLPLAMQHWEMSEAIRAPMYSTLAEGTGSAVSRELSWAIDNRLLEMRSWLYQPFLYYLIHKRYASTSVDHLVNSHHHPTSLSALPSTRNEFLMALFQETPSLDEDEALLLYHLLCSGIECNLKILDVRSLRHRHHGLWYDLRAAMCASLILLAVVKSGNEHWIPGGAQVLWGNPSPPDYVIGGRIAHVLVEFDFWSVESPDMVRHRGVLEEVTRYVMQR